MRSRKHYYYVNSQTIILIEFWLFYLLLFNKSVCEQKWRNKSRNTSLISPFIKSIFKLILPIDEVGDPSAAQLTKLTKAVQKITSIFGSPRKFLDKMNMIKFEKSFKFFQIIWILETKIAYHSLQQSKLKEKLDSFLDE